MRVCTHTLYRAKLQAFWAEFIEYRPQFCNMREVNEIMNINPVCDIR